jgi:alpha-glucoside transport system substrate-binding protein
MGMTLPRKALRTVAVAGALSLTLAACGGGDDDDGGGTAAGGEDVDCADFEQYGDLSGETVTVYTGIVTPEDTPHIESWEPFEECTGATIRGEFDKAFETQILVRAQAGNPPDIAFVPQPGLVQQLVSTGAAVPAPEETSANVDEFWGEDWKAYGTVDDQFYAAPLGANMKSLVWYSPAEFEENGYEIPTTLDELRELSDTIAETGKKPWCAGISSGEATGWPITDWHEDMMLRLHGADVYDQWVNHEIPFDGPESTEALDAVGEYLKNDDYVNGGLGDVRSIATTTFQDAGLPILDGACSLHRQASFYAANWPEGTEVAEDGEVFAFYLPGATEDEKPVLGGGEFTLAFSDGPAVQAFQTYLSSDLWANIKADAHPEGGWVSSNTGVDPEKFVSPIDRLAVETFQDESAVFRFDGSDQMPAAIGSNEYWTQATNWITGQDTQTTVSNIENAWPAG